jgi:hypothetical protein
MARAARDDQALRRELRADDVRRAVAPVAQAERRLARRTSALTSVLVAVRSVSSTLVREIEGPLNVVMGLGTAEGNARELLGAGVQRISLGGSIARSALGFVRRCAQELRDAGSITFATGQIPPQPELNALFARARAMYVPGVTYDAARGVRGRSSQISAWPRG